MRYDDRDFTPAAYGDDYTHNLRWRYRPGRGEGTDDDPFFGGGSFGVGYGRAGGSGRYTSPTPSRQRMSRRNRARPHRRPGTAARDYDRAYPYFGSAAAFEAAQGYPPGDTLVPETHERTGWRTRNWYDEDYDLPAESRSPRGRRHRRRR